MFALRGDYAGVRSTQRILAPGATRFKAFVGDLATLYDDFESLVQVGGQRKAFEGISVDDKQNDERVLHNDTAAPPGMAAAQAQPDGYACSKSVATA